MVLRNLDFHKIILQEPLAGTDALLDADERNRLDLLGLGMQVI